MGKGVVYMTDKGIAELIARARGAGQLSGICGRLIPTPVNWDAESMEMISAFVTDEEMGNPVGNLHGGVIATIFDHGLGAAGACFSGGGFTPTVALNVEYLRPVPVGERLYVHAVVTKSGRTLIHVCGELLKTPESKNPMPQLWLSTQRQEQRKNKRTKKA